MKKISLATRLERLSRNWPSTPEFSETMIRRFLQTKVMPAAELAYKPAFSGRIGHALAAVCRRPASEVTFGDLAAVIRKRYLPEGAEPDMFLHVLLAGYFSLLELSWDLHHEASTKKVPLNRVARDPEKRFALYYSRTPNEDYRRLAIDGCFRSRSRTMLSGCRDIFAKSVFPTGRRSFLDIYAGVISGAKCRDFSSLRIVMENSDPDEAADDYEADLFDGTSCIHIADLMPLVRYFVVPVTCLQRNEEQPVMMKKEVCANEKQQ